MEGSKGITEEPFIEPGKKLVICGGVMHQNNKEIQYTDAMREPTNLGIAQLIATIEAIRDKKGQGASLEDYSTIVVHDNSELERNETEGKKQEGEGR